MLATFYNCSSDNNVVKKSLTQVASADIQECGEFTVESPTFKMARDDNLLSANYMYVEALHRYYYVTLRIEGNFMYVDANSDPLTSFWNSYKNSPCIAYRSTSKPDVRIVDDKVFKKPKPTLIFRKVGAAFTPTNSNNYVLIVSGKGDGSTST